MRPATRCWPRATARRRRRPRPFSPSSLTTRANASALAEHLDRAVALVERPRARRARRRRCSSTSRTTCPWPRARAGDRRGDGGARDRPRAWVAGAGGQRSVDDGHLARMVWRPRRARRSPAQHRDHRGDRLSSERTLLRPAGRSRVPGWQPRGLLRASGATPDSGRAVRPRRLRPLARSGERRRGLLDRRAWDEALVTADSFIAEADAGTPNFMYAYCRAMRGRIRLARGDRHGRARRRSLARWTSPARPRTCRCSIRPWPWALAPR